MAPEASSTAPVAAAEEVRLPSFSPFTADGERSTVALVIEGRRYVEEVQVSLPARLYAARHGGWSACFAGLYERGVPMFEILNWAAYPLGDGLSETLKRFEKPPVSARVVLDATRPRVTRHADGYVFPPAEVLAAVAACLEGDIPRPLALRFAPASVTTQELLPSVAPIATFSTPYADVPNRVHNLRLACRLLNATVIEAGAEFSFNAQVGPRTQERGFRPAKIISDGAFVEGIGGGVCQVSTTLYNAAMAAGLRQVEVRRHSLAVHYVAPARDAMVSDWSDLRFTNDTDYPVYLYAGAYDGKVIVRLYGVERGRIKLCSSSRTVSSHRDVDEQGNVLSDTSGYRLLHAGQDSVEGILTRTMGGETQLLRRHTYPAVDAVWQKIEEKIG